MIKLVTFEQAKKLKELGFRDKVTAYYVDGSIDFNSPINWNTNEGLDENDEPQDDDGYYSAPAISEALEWFREVKGIECEVCLRLCFMGDTGEAVFGGYEYIVFDHNTNKTISSTIYHNRNEAESSLLYALIEYVSI